MILDTSLTPDNAIEWIRRIRGPAAINTIKVSLMTSHPLIK